MGPDRHRAAQEPWGNVQKEGGRTSPGSIGPSKNAYGPTEATVTATWTELRPAKPVTIGGPLPTYTIAILEAARDVLVDEGKVGEIAVGGIGVAVGYLNREDLTRKAFVPDFLGLENNPGHRLYRTGDLGRINDDGEIEYLGRIDTQVKIRGYRIELAEIENVLLEAEGVAQAVVTTHEVEPDSSSLPPISPALLAVAASIQNNSCARCADACRVTWCRPTSKSWKPFRCCRATRPTARRCPRLRVCD